MLLRGSGEHSGKGYDLQAIVGKAADEGVVAGALVLLDFADAYFAKNGGLAAARDRVRDALGPGALVDAAGIIAIFDAVVRIANATGIPLEDEKARVSEDFRAELGIDDFTPARED